MKQSDVVTIYKDMVSKVTVEGEAILLRKIGEDSHAERWIVRFTNQDIVKGNVERTIIKETL